MPRPIIPGTTYMVTRTCTQRQYLMAPSEVVNQVFLYCLAVAAKRYRILVHAVVVMSNHWHGVITDRDGNISEFMSWVNEFVAKCLNAHYGRSENFFSDKRYNAVSLESPETIVHKIAYVLANPVAAGAVERPCLWAGIHTAGIPFGAEPIRAKRPKVFFRMNGRMPVRTELKITRPPGFKSIGNQAFTALVRTRLRALVKGIRRKSREEGREFQGPEACRKFRPTDRPKSKRPLFALSPRVAALEKKIRIAALKRLKAFWADYRTARARWLVGDHDVVFPPGTYWLRIHAKVRCRAPT